MAEAHLSKEQVDAIKQGIIALIESGQAPEDLMGHLKDMGISSPEELMTTHLPEGHWEMMKDKWLSAEQSPEAKAVDQDQAEMTPEFQGESAPRIPLPQDWAPPAEKAPRLAGLVKAGEEHDLSKRCVMHKSMCKGGDNCPMCKMCMKYEKN